LELKRVEAMLDFLNLKKSLLQYEQIIMNPLTALGEMIINNVSLPLEECYDVTKINDFVVEMQNRVKSKLGTVMDDTTDIGLSTKKLEEWKNTLEDMKDKIDQVLVEISARLDVLKQNQKKT